MKVLSKISVWMQKAEKLPASIIVMNIVISTRSKSAKKDNLILAAKSKSMKMLLTFLISAKSRLAEWIFDFSK